MDQRGNPKKKLRDFGKEYFVDISVNALKHIIRAKNVGERRFWILMFAMAVFGSGFCVLEVFQVYESSFTKTTILSTSYPYAHTAFPSVTICEPSRVRATVIESLFKNATGRPGSYEEALFNMMTLLSISRLPLFADLVRMNDWKEHFNELNKLNVSDILLKAMRPCNEIFDSRCWWRNNFYNCCDLFEVQKTSYGYCYSFNSDVSEYSKSKTLSYGMHGDRNDFWLDDQGLLRPKRTGGYGPWSGLRFSMRAQKIPSCLHAKPGVMVMVKDPSALPLDVGIMVAKGTSGYIRVWGDKVFPTSRLIRVKPEKRYCLYPHEQKYLGRGYLRANCLFSCYARLMYHDCGCVPSFNYFLYETDRSPYPECNLEGLVCLADHSTNLININDRDRNRSSDLKCQCPGDCYSQKYRSTMIVLNETENPDQITVDVFFHKSTCFLYETDIVFDFMNALVSYGGVCGLFLGASLISGVELINFLTFRLHDYWSDRRNQNKIVQRFVN